MPSKTTNHRPWKNRDGFLAVQLSHGKKYDFIPSAITFRHWGLTLPNRVVESPIWINQTWRKKQSTNINQPINQYQWTKQGTRNHPHRTLAETHIFAPKNGWLEYKPFLLGRPILRCENVSFRECIFFHWSNTWPTWRWGKIDGCTWGIRPNLQQMGVFPATTIICS